jgi:hypothetical protein
VKGALAFHESLAQNANLKSLDLSANPGLEASKEISDLLGVGGFSVSSLVFVRKDDFEKSN